MRRFHPRAALGGLALVLFLLGGASARVAAGPPKKPKTASTRPAGAVDNGAAVAEINGEKITVGDLREGMKSLAYRHERASVGDERARQAVFRNLVSDRLVLQHMKASERMDAADFRDRMEAVRTIGLGNMYVQVKRRDFVPADNEVRRLLPRYWKQVSVRVFFGATREEAEKARGEVLSGGDFEAIVKARSVGPGADRGGLMETLRFGAAFFPEHIDHLLFTQPKGWVSDIFENELGFCFARVEGSQDDPPETIGKIAAGVREQLRDVAVARMIEEEYDAHRVEADAALLDALDNVPTPQWKDRFGTKLAVVDGEPVTVRDFYWYRMVGFSGKPPEKGGGRLGEQFRSFVRYRGFARKAEQENLGRMEEVKKGIARYVERTLLEMFNDEVAAGVRVTEKEGRAFFEKNKDRLKKPEGRELRLIVVREERAAREIAALLKGSPAEFEKLARTGSVDPSRTRGGAIGVIYRNQMEEEVNNAVFAASEGEVIGPLPSRGQFFIFRVDRKVPPVENPKYGEHSAEALEFARAEKVNEAVRKKRDELYRKAAIITYKDVLSRVDWPEPSGGAPMGHGGGH